MFTATKESITSLYDEVLKGKRNRFPRGFWKEEGGTKTAIILVRYLFEDHYGWDREAIKANASTSFLRDHKLSGLLRYVYGDDFERLMKDAYPDLHPWELKRVPKSFWKNEANCIEATRWLIEEHLLWNEEDVKNRFNKNIFYDNGFTGLLKWGWNGDTMRAIQTVYADRFRPWELKSIPLTQWRECDGAASIREFVEEMGWDHEQLKRNWRVRTLKHHHMYRVVVTVFDRSMWKAIQAAFPGVFHQSDFPPTR
ncbi:DUF4046 domain-containing protein (plasmid) [Pontibacillus sp. ALD_SL1]|uniref:DUF4046 domain-containing protein n=1 Tax=Pontibacillus sp. ALD_SL1 TaxID=2777185 RepID=UPI001A95BD7A|nr:DUF4046 domain-containing protein [Pontibacillus sp. ALD_SL1]QST02850.1 DUF4046 domain-containing protein [Pontibacillus sp. ALD_SL1]